MICAAIDAGYAADGYARARGVGCVCVTFTVCFLQMLSGACSVCHLPYGKKLGPPEAAMLQKSQRTTL